MERNTHEAECLHLVHGNQKTRRIDLEVQIKFKNVPVWIRNEYDEWLFWGVYTDEENKLSKFIAFTIKDSDFYTYSQGIEVITDNYINIHNKHHYDTLEKLIKEIDNKNQELELHNVYTSNNLTSICFMVLDQIVRHENLQIKTCLNCGRYFIPTYRQNEIYCDLANVDKSPTCREKGAGEQYRKNLENNKVQALYRRIYQQKFMTAYRNKESKAIQKEFDKWKKEAKDKISKIKKGKLTEDEVYKWLVKNK